jgi:hypothetical protein
MRSVELEYVKLTCLRNSASLLNAYHDSIGGDPSTTKSVKKSKSTSSIRKRDTDESPAPKRQKTNEVEVKVPTQKDWTPLVKKVETIERDEHGDLLVFLRMKDGKGLKVSMMLVKAHCPVPMLEFYEEHLKFK